jgi:serine/threonine-protein kinase
VSDRPPDDTDPAIAQTAAQTAEDTPGVRKGGGKQRAVHTGDALGRYDLVEDIGEGGMATVYRARDRELRRDVAIKVLFPHLARRPEIVQRFHREARSAAGLEHPNVLRIYDVGGAEADDPPYIVMELIKGHTLLQEIERRGPVLAEVVACIGALLADALAAAHKAGIIHRDIKPANVLIATGGRLLLADFGVARLETEDSLVTKTGALLGTPAYMSPEQATGDTATAKSDLYSLGATLYQLATGSLPYTGSPAKIMASIATGGMVSAVRRRPVVGPDLSRVIDRLMKTEPAERPASAVEVAAELRALAAAGGLGDATDELAAFFADPEQYLAARTPTVVSALVTAGERAVADGKLPRAMALADRAGALAPTDPAVAALIARVTSRGRSSGRRRTLAIGAAVVAAIGGGATLVVTRHRAASLPLDGPVAGAVPADAAPDATELVVASVLPDAALADAPPGDAPRRPLDAAVRTRVDAAGEVDATAATVVAIDAPPPPPPPDAAEPMATLTIDNDAWCDVTIDGVALGRTIHKPIPVRAGRHAVHCQQGQTDRKWDDSVELAPGEARTIHHEMLGGLAVTIGVDEAIIDGVSHRRGEVVPLKTGRHGLARPGVPTTYMTITSSCTVLVRGPDFDCYP